MGSGTFFPEPEYVCICTHPITTAFRAFSETGYTVLHYTVDRLNLQLRTCMYGMLM
jgi:hypothetical protein